MISAHRAGMTLIEMLISLTLFTIVLVAAAGALRNQTRVFAAGNERLAVVQNYRYALNSLQQDLRVAGTGVVPRQPSLVYAGADAIAFNADYASRVENDISAVFHEPDAPASAVSALTPERAIAIPGTTFSYPDSSFVAGGANSPAETIIFFLEADATTGRTDDFVLYRQVNDLAPELLSRNLLRLDDGPFFAYTELVVSDTAPDALRPIASAALPLAHSVPLHMAAADTGAAGRVDGVRAVRVNMVATNGLTGDDEFTERLSRLIWLHNVRQQVVQFCGDQPLGLPAPDVAAGNSASSGDPEVRITWQASVDETGGEKDVVRYLVWRRVGGAGPWGDPYLSLPAGNGTYLYVDAAVERGQAYEYAVSAQDCTPAVSDRSPGSLVVVPLS